MDHNETPRRKCGTTITEIKSPVQASENQNQYSATTARWVNGWGPQTHLPTAKYTINAWNNVRSVAKKK